MLEGIFKEGKKHGAWIQYDDQGKIVSQKYFQDGMEAPLPVAKKDPNFQPKVPSRTSAEVPSEIPSRSSPVGGD